MDEELHRVTPKERLKDVDVIAAAILGCHPKRVKTSIWVERNKNGDNPHLCVEVEMQMTSDTAIYGSVKIPTKNFSLHLDPRTPKPMSARKFDRKLVEAAVDRICVLMLEELGRVGEA